MYLIATFYHFFDFPDFALKQQPLKNELQRLGIKGSLLIAAEGINGTLAGTREAIDAFLAHLQNDIIKGTLEHKESFHDTQPFKRTKVRLKKEVISLGVPPPLGGRLGGGRNQEPLSQTSPHPNPPPNGEGIHQAGIYIDPKDWNTLISDPDVVTIDTRNTYEIHLGTFEGAINPDIRTFKQLPDFAHKTLDPTKHKKIATFCTGGVRCEKFTAWLKDQGFENVYHLKGGILKYLEEIPEKDSKWQGECYVFDERVAVGHGLVPSQTASMCPGCGHALNPEDRMHSLYIEGERCGFCG